MVNRLCERVGEPLFEILHVGEDVGHQEMHETPQLHHVVLQWCSCDQESSLGVEPQEGLPSLRLEILYVLSLIQDHVVPLFSPEGKVVLDHQLVRGDTDVEGVLLAPAMSLDLSLLLGAEVGEDLEAWAPLFKFHLPVHDDRCWYNDEMRTPDALVASERGQHSDGLNCFTKTHLVCQDSVKLTVVKSHQPIEANDLILSKRATEEERNLSIYLNLFKSGTSWLESLCDLDLFLC